MQCPLCEQLRREHTLACQAEAMATLEERHSLFLVPARADTLREAHEKPHETILSSRKQQLKIRTHLEEHKALAHSA